MTLTFDDFVRHSNFGSFKLVNEMADMKFKNALILKEEIEKVLKDPIQ